MSNRSIKQLVDGFEIPYLLHFTRASNLASILKHGIYPVAQVHRIGASPQRNDQYRLDGHLNATSVSIAHPNCQMLYKYRMLDTSVDWAILLLNPSVLWQKDCAFCRHNAADSRISRLPIRSLMTEDALRGMFQEIDGLAPREEQRLLIYDPTDVQAEVMVFDVIDPTSIGAVVFNTLGAKNTYSSLLTKDHKVLLHPNNKGFFGTRSYSRLYQ